MIFFVLEGSCPTQQKGGGGTAAATQLRRRLGLAPIAILALRGALKFFAVLNVLSEDFMVFWREHDELFNRFPEEFKNSKSFSSGPPYFRFVLLDSLF